MAAGVEYLGQVPRQADSIAVNSSPTHGKHYTIRTYVYIGYRCRFDKNSGIYKLVYVIINGENQGKVGRVENPPEIAFPAKAKGYKKRFSTTNTLTLHPTFMCFGRQGQTLQKSNLTFKVYPVKFPHRLFLLISLV